MDFIAKSTRQSGGRAAEDRISRKVTVKTIAKGRLGIPNRRHNINALKLSWIRKLKTSDHNWKGIIT